MGEQQSQLPGNVRPKKNLTKFREFQRIYLQIARRNWPALVSLAALSLFAGFETARLETAYAKQQNPQSSAGAFFAASPAHLSDRKSTRLNSSHVRISYAVFCLKKKKNNHLSSCLPDG